MTNIDLQLLTRQIARSVFEAAIRELLETYLHMEAARDVEWVDTGRGVAQGSPLSPLLSNIALADFDGARRFAKNERVGGIGESG